MIIDFLKRPGFARNYDILDAETGENLNHLKIVYADDVAGVIRRFGTDDNGNFLLDEHGCLAEPIEEQREIHLVLKPEAQGAIKFPRLAGFNKR